MKGFLTAPSPVETNYIPREFFARDLADEGGISMIYSNTERNKLYRDRYKLHDLAFDLSKSDFGKKLARLGEMNWEHLLIDMYCLLDERQDLAHNRRLFRGYMLRMEMEKKAELRKITFSWKRAQNF